jgi:lysylphosphatidylglycerol synthase-like protein
VVVSGWDEQAPRPRLALHAGLGAVHFAVGVGQTPVALKVSHVVRFGLLCLGLALLVYITKRLGFREIVAMLFGLRWSVFPVLLLYAIHHATRALALVRCVRQQGRLTFLDALWVRMSGEAVEYLTFSGPLLAEPTKAWLLGRRGLEVSEGLAATLAEYLASSVAASAMSVIGFGYVLLALQPRGAARVAAIIGLIAMAAFAVLVVGGIGARLHILGSIVRGLASLGPGAERFQQLLPVLDPAEHLLIGILRDTPRRLAEVFVLELAAQGFLALELWYLLKALKVPTSMTHAILIEGVTKFMNASYSFVPGQLGVAEGTYAVIFGLFALPAAAGVTISFARRVRSVVAALVGLVALVSLRMPPRSPADYDPRHEPP